MAVLIDELVDRVGEIIPRYSMLSGGDRVGVAVSGGADSVALLHILHRLRSRFAPTLLVLHANHQLRGAESDEDARFVREMAASLGLEAAVEQAPVAVGNLEQEARRARREFFHRCIEQYELACVALAHTRSDQAETVLFRILRGSGLTGLVGMRPKTPDRLIRPLLTTSRAEVRGWAAAENLTWREDRMNQDSRYARNRLRNEAIPLLRESFNVNVEGALAALAELAGDEEDFWIQHVEPIFQKLCEPARRGLLFSVPALAALPIALRRRLVRRALAEIRGNLRSIDMEHVQAILRICLSSHGHDRVIVPDVDAFRSFETLLLARPEGSGPEARHYRLELRCGVECQLPFEAGSICITPLTPEPANCVKVKEEQQFSAEVADLDEAALTEAGGSLAVRNWEPGDEIRRAGHAGAEKVKSLFQEYKILLWERRHWPVVVARHEVVWVRRFGAAAKFRAKGEGRQRLRLIYRPALEEQTNRGE